MPHYSRDRKEAILKKMMPPNHQTIAEISAQEGIHPSTLYNWRKKSREKGIVLPSNSAKPNQWSSADKFRIVIETAALSEAELGEYCRRNGLYTEQILQWKEACMTANDRAEERSQQQKQALKVEKKRIKKLEAELRRKEKALAETAALLTLSKKAQAIWGVRNEDD
jgi:transposase-like protein